jgi:hypothetical protein
MKVYKFLGLDLLVNFAAILIGELAGRTTKQPWQSRCLQLMSLVTSHGSQYLMLCV